MSKVKIFACSASKELAASIADVYGTELGELHTERFKDGEICPVFEESVRGCEVFLVQSTFPPGDNMLELILAIDAAKRASAGHVTAVVPYFGYARQDRKDRPRVGIGAKVIANMIQTAGADRIMTLDLHAGQIQGFFDIPVDHLYGSRVFVPYLRSLEMDNITFASPDVGGAKRARSYASYFQANVVICDKYRKRANEVASMQVIGDVEGANVIIVDDMCDTGGTLCKAANLLKEKGAKTVRAAITHPVLSGNAYDNINNSVLEELITTDTIPLKHKSDKIRVLSVDDMFGKAIRKLIDNESISSLFI